MDHLLASSANEGSFGVSSQRILQEESKFGVAVWHVWLPFCERIDASSKVCQTLIDIRSLFQDVAFSSCLSYALTSRQIYQVQSTL